GPRCWPPHGSRGSTRSPASAATPTSATSSATSPPASTGSAGGGAPPPPRGTNAGKSWRCWAAFPQAARARAAPARSPAGGVGDPPAGGPPPGGGGPAAGGGPGPAAAATRRDEDVAPLLAGLPPAAREALDRLSPLGVVSRLSGRLLIAHGAADDSIPFT